MLVGSQLKWSSFNLSLFVNICILVFEVLLA